MASFRQINYANILSKDIPPNIMLSLRKHLRLTKPVNEMSMRSASRFIDALIYYRNTSSVDMPTKTEEESEIEISLRKLRFKLRNEHGRVG